METKNQIEEESDVCGMVSIYPHKQLITIRLDRDATKAIDSEFIIFDKVEMMLKIPTIDSRKTYKITPNVYGSTITCNVSNPEDVIGNYEMVEDKNGFKLYRIEE